MGNLNFNLPESTAFNRRVPKQKFYENCAVSAALKRSFVDEITAIWWRNKLAATTLNLAKGAAVTEIEVFEIELANGHLNEEVLRQMDRMIPYHLLFVLTFENRAQAWIGYKEASATGAKTSRSPRTSPVTPSGRGWRSRSPRWKSSHGRRSSRRRSLNWYNR